MLADGLCVMFFAQGARTALTSKTVRHNRDGEANIFICTICVCVYTFVISHERTPRVRVRRALKLFDLMCCYDVRMTGFGAWVSFWCRMGLSCGFLISIDRVRVSRSFVSPLRCTDDFF